MDCRIVTKSLGYLNSELKYEITHHDLLWVYFKRINPLRKKLIIPEAQIYFPASMYSVLVKKYPSFPIFVATSGHAYDMNIIINAQVMGHVWDKNKRSV